MNNNLQIYTEQLYGAINVDYIDGSIKLYNTECNIEIIPLIGSNSYLIKDLKETSELLADKDTTLEMFKALGINPERFYEQWAKSNFQNAD